MDSGSARDSKSYRNKRKTTLNPWESEKGKVKNHTIDMSLQQGLGILRVVRNSSRSDSKYYMLDDI